MDDTKETIDKCLECKKDECDNCIGQTTRKEYNHAAYLKSKDKRILWDKAKYAAHRERRKATRRAFYERHLEEERAKARERYHRKKAENEQSE